MPFWSNLSGSKPTPNVSTKPSVPIHDPDDVYSKAAPFIAQFEGFRSAPYMPTPNDRPTIGFGTTFYPSGAAVTLADPACTRDQALAWLSHDLAGANATLDSYVKVPLTAGQRVALLSLVYNIGSGNFSKSTLLKLLNSKRYGDAGRQFTVWNLQKGVVLKGLVTRRAVEKALFESDPPRIG